MRIERSGIVWMWYAERTEHFMQVGVGPVLLSRDRREPWWRWRIMFNPD